MKKKILVTLSVIACALLLVVGSVAGTLAYLTSKAETMTNTFTAGKVVITMDEAKVNAYGDAVTPAVRVQTNEYKLIPGHTYTKDPTIYVEAGSESCYLFVKVVNGISAIEVAAADGDTIAEQMGTNGWKPLSGVDNVWYYEAGVDAREATENVAVPVFGTFTLADDANVAGYVTTGNAAAKIEVTAYAIQADGLTLAEAWTAGGWN